MFARLASSAACLMIAACSSASASNTAQDAGVDSHGSQVAPDTGIGLGQLPPPAFANTTGEATSLAAYPPGPYGVGIGSVVQNFQLDGYRNPAASTTALQPIQLADFYNPHAKDTSYVPPKGGVDDRIFPADSTYPQAGKLKPTVLLIDVASVWCGPCNNEAEYILPPQHTSYLPCGGEFLLNLADGPTPGTAARPASLSAWTHQYSLDYPSAIDPAYILSPLEPEGVYPQNIIIDTTTMKIVAVLGGEAIQGTCGTTEYNECATASDCTTCSAGLCGDYGTTCTTDADCASIGCTQFPFWTTFEQYLDKTRTGCSVK